MQRAVRIDTLQWFIGIYLAVRGALMLVLPHTLSTHVFVPIEPHLPWLGAWQVLGGAALIGSVTLVPRRIAVMLAHLLAGSALLQAAMGHLLAGTWTGVAAFGSLGIGTAIAPFLPQLNQPPKAGRPLDLFALLMGLRMSLEGLLILAPFNQQQFTAALYNPIRAHLPWYGTAYLASGMLLLAVYFVPKRPRSLFACAHLMAGSVLWAWTASLGVPTWNSAVFFGGLGTLLAGLPWLGPRLRCLNPSSLRTQLAIALVAIVTLPLLLVVTLVSLPQERAAIEQALALQQTLARSLAREISSYVDLHRAAVVALANQPGLEALSPNQQQELLQMVSQAYPDMVMFATYDADGRAIARSDGRPLNYSIADLKLYQDVRRTGKPALEIRVGQVIQQPLFTFAAPIYTADEQMAGLAVGSIKATQVLEHLIEASASAELDVYLVNHQGKVIAHPNYELVESLTDYSHVPPVSGLLSQKPVQSGLQYWDGTAWQLAGYARVPDLEWGVVVERPAEEVLAAINAGRNRDFMILVLVASAALTIGLLLAHRLTDSLSTLTYAAGRLATGDAQPPLPRSGIAEVAHLSAVFGAMRDRLVQRTAERDRVEAELRQSEAKVRRLVESNIIGAIVTDLNGAVIESNEAFLGMVGYTQDDLQAGSVRWDEMTPPEYAKVTQRSLAELRETGVCSPFEKEFVRKDGSRVPVLIGSACLEGSRDRAIAFVLDLSDRKRLEREREQLLARERAAREEAETANRLKDQFLAVLSHELRSPLNPILGWANLLRSRKLDAQSTERALETIERNARLQTQLIDDLLDVSRILRGKMVLDVRPINLATTIEAALETVRPAAEAKQIQIQTVLDREVGRVLGDSGRLQQVVWNLLSNAVKFTPAKGQVTVRLERVGTEAQIQVTDTGKGINPQFLPHVFDYFRQEDGHTTRKFGGLGLGLAIVRHLSELHGGTVWADSPGDGQGATFTVRLPLMEGAWQPEGENGQLAQDLASRSPQLLAGLRILAVDNEPDMQWLLMTLLSEFGAEVKVTTCAEEALSALDQFAPHLLISDIGMPEVDGYMLLRQIRQRSPQQGGQIPAIALTAYAGESNQQQAIAAGFQRHIAKPVDPMELAKAVADLTGRNSML